MFEEKKLKSTNMIVFKEPVEMNKMFSQHDELDKSVPNDYSGKTKNLIYSDVKVALESGLIETSTVKSKFKSLEELERYRDTVDFTQTNEEEKYNKEKELFDIQQEEERQRRVFLRDQAIANSHLRIRQI